MSKQKERWAEIPSWLGMYEASSLGRIRSVSRVIERRNGVQYREAGRIKSQRVNRTGYPIVCLRNLGVVSTVSVHRLVCEAFHGSPRPDQEVAHNDGDRLNSSANNLRWATRSENALDKLAHGTMMRGGVHTNAKLSDEQARQIFVDRSETNRVCALRYGVSESVVAGIRRGTRWRHLSKAA